MKSSTIPKPARTRILLDLSHTHFSNYRTGIQRVVRSLHTELPNIARELGIDFAAVVLVNNEFVYLNESEVHTIEPESTLDDVLKSCPNW